MLASTRSPNSVRTISGKGAVFIEARVTEVTHHKGRIYVRSFTQLTFYTTESLGGLRNKRSTYTCRKERFLEGHRHPAAFTNSLPRTVRIPPHSEPRHPTRRAQKPAKRLPGPPALPHDLAHAVRRALPDDLPAHRQLLRRPTWPGPTGSPGLHRAHATTGQRHVRGPGHRHHRHHLPNPRPGRRPARPAPRRPGNRHWRRPCADAMPVGLATAKRNPGPARSRTGPAPGDSRILGTLAAVGLDRRHGLLQLRRLPSQRRYPPARLHDDHHQPAQHSAGSAVHLCLRLGPARRRLGHHHRIQRRRPDHVSHLTQTGLAAL